MVIMVFNILCVIFLLEINVFIYEFIRICRCSDFVGIWKIFSYDLGNGRRWRLVIYSVVLFVGGVVFYGINDLIFFYV